MPAPSHSASHLVRGLDPTITPTPHTRTELCEWNPAKDRPCHAGEHDALAVYGVGSRAGTHLHLCLSCAALPRFKRYKKNVLPGAAVPATRTPEAAAL